MPDPNQIIGDDDRPTTRPIYCYIIQQIDQENQPPIFLTSHAEPVVVGGMPDKYNADEEQEFSPAAIGHGPIRREGNFDKSLFDVRALMRDVQNFSRYILTGALPRTEITVFKINPGRELDGDVADWGPDTWLTQCGLIANFSVTGWEVTLSCVPEPLFSDHEIPRWRCSRVCNHQFGSKYCGVNLFDFDLDTTILEIRTNVRKIVIGGHKGGVDGNWFRDGVLVHKKTRLRLPVARSYWDGPRTILVLNQWSPDFEVGDAVRALPGCDHTFPMCKSRFNNAPNFGGFDKIPNKNPTLHGINANGNTKD